MGFLLLCRFRDESLLPKVKKSKKLKGFPFKKYDSFFGLQYFLLLLLLLNFNKYGIILVIESIINYTSNRVLSATSTAQHLANKYYFVHRNEFDVWNKKKRSSNFCKLIENSFFIFLLYRYIKGISCLKNNYRIGFVKALGPV